MKCKYLQYTQSFVLSNKTFRNILDIIQNREAHIKKMCSKKDKSTIFPFLESQYVKGENLPVIFNTIKNNILFIKKINDPK